MVRIFGVILLSSALITPGFILCEKLQRRKKYLLFFSNLCIRLSASISDGGESIFEILKRECRDKYRFILDIDRSLINKRIKLYELFGNNSIDAEDIDDLADFFSLLGTTDAIGQKKHCELYHNRFNLKYNDAAQLVTTRGRVYKSLFISLGLTVFIIMI